MAHQEPKPENKNADGHAGHRIGPHFKWETVAQLLSSSRATLTGLATISPSSPQKT